MADQQRQHKRQRLEVRENRSIPVLKELLTNKTFEETFLKYKLVHIPKGIENNVTDSTCEPSHTPLSWKDVKEVFLNLNQKDKDSWCVENGESGKTLSPENFLDPKKDENDDCTGYCSFLVQNDQNAKKDMLDRVPISDFSFETKFYYGPSIWVFFGRNIKSKNSLQGRPEHTDSVTQDGTWHYQLSGTKTWFVRPTQNLLEHIKEFGGENDWCESDVIQIDCNEGDLLLIDTCLWWHRTVIPSQPSPSVSYARDFFLQDPSLTQDEASSTVSLTDENEGMTNIDGIYASRDISSGTIIFKETGMSTSLDLYSGKIFDNSRCYICIIKICLIANCIDRRQIGIVK